MNTNKDKRTRRKFTDQQKQDILAEAEAVKAAGGEYRTALAKHALTSSTLAKWRKELKGKAGSPVNRNRKASKAPKRKIATRTTSKTPKKSKLMLDNIVAELRRLEDRRAKLLSMKIADIL